MKRTGFGWLRIGSNGGLFEHGNQPYGSKKKAGYFLTSCASMNFSNNVLHLGVNKKVFLLKFVKHAVITF
jgi:hypothetical protein